MKNTALIIGGSNGIGLSIALCLLDRGYEKLYILDYSYPSEELKSNKITFIRFNLLSEDYSILSEFNHINTLIITSGIGRVAPFDNLLESEIINSFKINSIAVCRIIKHFYTKILYDNNFYCCVMGSIAGYISSPLFAVYAATKAAIGRFIESVNIEIEKQGSYNRILNVSPGVIHGTRFNGKKNEPQLNINLANQIIDKMLNKDCLFIPQYDEIYKDVITHYHKDPHQFGLESFTYKEKSNRIVKKTLMKIGYLSGTFDLFHIGHLNLLRRAKDYCDYLVVGVHKDASHKKKSTFIPFNERLEIIKSIRYVDAVIEAYSEDIDAYHTVNYDYLFVGDDYKGSERFNKYEEYFKDKGVEIIYFPYTQETSSTELRHLIDRKKLK